MAAKQLFVCVVLIVALQLALKAQVPGYVPANGLNGWWPFNGNANDESGSGNNGVVNGATLTADRNSVANQAYDFTGAMNNFISVAAPNVPLSSSAITISAWFKMKSYPTNSSIAVLGWGQWTTNNARYVGFRQSANNLLTYAQYYNDVNCTFAYSLNTWYHYVVTYSNNVAKFYINSALQGTFAIYTPSTLTGPLNFGKSPGNTDYITGSLDDIGIWNRALDSADISNLYKAVLNTTNIQKTVSVKNIQIFPNPANDQVTVVCSPELVQDGHQLKLFNALGQQVHQLTLTQSTVRLDLSSFTAKGIYMLQISDGNNKVLQTHKLIKN